MRQPRFPFAPLLGLFVLLGPCVPWRAAQASRIAAIEFSGNVVTRPEVMLREMTVAVGGIASPENLAQSRQALLDLGLFREVELHTERIADSDSDVDAVALHVRVREKRYLLPLPRLDTSSDRDFSLGGQLRWSNVAGRNQRLDLTYQEGRFPDDRRREREREAAIGWTVPYLGTRDWGTQLRMERLERVTPSPAGSFEETFHSFEALVLHDRTRGRPRHGWRFGLGMLWEDQTTRGRFAPPPDGEATALVGSASYSDLRFHVYSETGRRASARWQGAAEGWGSDYGYSRWQANWFESRPWGEGDHQTWHVLAQLGQRSGGPNSRNEFSLGGSGRLRGYDSDFLEGDRYYYGAVEALRPLGRDWLRGVILLEVGGTDSDRERIRNGSAYASVGLGIRIRLTWFVDIEFEAGIAHPLRGGGGTQFFAGGN